MTDKKLDELPAVTSIVGTNILHQKNIGGDGTDKHITFSDFVKSIITDATATGAANSGNYLLIQNAGVTYKVTVDQLLEDMGNILVTDNTNMLSTDHVVWNDVSTGNTRKATVVSTVDKGIVGQPSDTATPTEIVCIVGTDTKRVTFANVAVKLESALDVKTLVSDPNADYVVVSDGSVTQKATYQNFFKEAINVLPATTPTYGATSTIAVDAVANGNAVKDTVKNFLEKSPYILSTLAAIDIDKANDKVLVQDASAGVTKLSTIADALGTAIASVPDVENGNGAGNVVAAALKSVMWLSQDYPPTYVDITRYGGSTEPYQLHGGSLQMGGVLIMWGSVNWVVDKRQSSGNIAFFNVPFFRNQFADTNYTVCITGTQTANWNAPVSLNGATKAMTSFGFFTSEEGNHDDYTTGISFILIGKA